MKLDTLIEIAQRIRTGYGNIDVQAEDYEPTTGVSIEFSVVDLVAEREKTSDTIAWIKIRQ